MTARFYFDWNATTPLRPEARAAMTAASDGNPSSVHAEGRAAWKQVEEARFSVAALVGADPRDLVFTSGGTEANVMALSPALGTRLFVSAVEHSSVINGGRFAPDQVEQVPVNAQGQVDLDVLRRRIAGVTRPLVSVMLANNETGVVQPIAEVAAIVHEAGGLLHVDAVQAAGKIALDINALGADLMTLSGHKIGGPKGIGALIRRNDKIPFDPLVRGGGQERGFRSGTENVPGIVGFGAAAKAARLALGSEQTRLAALRDRLEAGLRQTASETVIFGAGVDRLPNTTLFAVPGAQAETAVIALDLDGIAVSSGAACSSGKVAASHVLVAMGVAPDLASGEIRVSLGRDTTESDVERFIQAWNKVLQSLRKTQQGVVARGVGRMSGVPEGGLHQQNERP